MQAKTCRSCKTEKPLTAFPKNGGGKRKPNCLPCNRLLQGQWKIANLESVRLNDRTRKRERRRNDPVFYEKEINRKRFAKYGLTQNDFALLSEEQGHCCKICKEKSALLVDHCHTSGKVRGLLCSRCNRVLGFVQDDIALLQQAIAYLEARRR